MHHGVGLVVARIAKRTPDRTEATLQGDIHLLLRTAAFDLDPTEIEDVTLESPAGHHRRIDVEVGSCVIEVKRNLRSAGVREAAIDQLAGYVRTRQEALGTRYVGVLTDGAEWHLYHLDEHDEPVEVSAVHLDPTAPDAEAFVVWLEGVLLAA